MVVGFSLGIGLILAAPDSEVQRHYAFIFCVYHRTYVFDPYYLSDGNLPEKIKMVVMLNPLTNYLIMFRDLMLNDALPSWSSILIGIVEMVIALILGFMCFTRSRMNLF